MGLFENLGRKVEKFKKQAESVSEEQANRKCGDCGSLIYTERDDCPDCDSENVLVRKGWEPADDDDDTPEAETDATDDSADAESDGDERTE